MHYSRWIFILACAPILLAHCSQTTALHNSAFVQSELFFDLNNTVPYGYRDYFDWSDFDVVFDRKAFKAQQSEGWMSFEVVDDKGLSIPRKMLWNKSSLSR